MASKKQMIQDKAVELLKESPEGLRFSELQRLLRGSFPEIPLNSMNWYFWNLHITRSEEVHKPTRGLFKHRLEVPPGPTPSPVKEEAFYGPFADWIKNELGECTEAVALGGNYLGKKWGTPDVVGIYKPSRRDVVQFQSQILSAEIKTDPAYPVVAFGQAVAYRLFSSIVYVVEPNTMQPEDQDRIEALCMLFGVGFVLFNPNPSEPNFAIRVRAQRYAPDMYYVNEFADRLFNVKPEVFKDLFG